MLSFELEAVLAFEIQTKRQTLPMARLPHCLVMNEMLRADQKRSRKRMRKKKTKKKTPFFSDWVECISFLSVMPQSALS